MNNSENFEALNQAIKELEDSLKLLQDEIKQKDEKILKLQQLALAVSDGFEIYCDDIDGKNWFDVRDEICSN